MTSKEPRHAQAIVVSVDGQEAHGTITINVVDGRVSVLVNGIPFISSDDAASVRGADDIFDGLLVKNVGLPAVEIPPEIQHPFECIGSFLG